MLNARCYFHFSPVVVNTVVCCFADCYSYCRYKDVLSNKAINQPMRGKAQGVLQKVPKTLSLLLRLDLMRGEGAGRSWPPAALQASSMGSSQGGLYPTTQCPALSLGPRVWIRSALPRAFSGTRASFLVSACPCLSPRSPVRLLESLEE